MAVALDGLVGDEGAILVGAADDVEALLRAGGVLPAGAEEGAVNEILGEVSRHRLSALDKHSPFAR